MHGFLRTQKGIREKETDAAIFLANIHLPPLAGAPLSLVAPVTITFFKVFAPLFP